MDATTESTMYFTFVKRRDEDVTARSVKPKRPLYTLLTIRLAYAFDPGGNPESKSHEPDSCYSENNHKKLHKLVETAIALCETTHQKVNIHYVYAIRTNRIISP